jgi:Na+-translocating ferredoxin:NAD+ oxidoreductase RnfC subunit
MREQIIAKIREAGVVGAGGAGFPTHVKVAAAADTVIVNGAECEPLLRVDQQLMEFAATRVVSGLAAVMEATGAAEGVIAIKGKHKRAIAALAAAVGKNMRLGILGDFYPAGDEHVLVHEVLGRLVPQGAIPLSVGCVVTNVETLLNVAAAQGGGAVTHSYVTVTGEVAQPVALRLPIGTTVADALALAGVEKLAGLRVIDGGPMMGKLVADLGQPITKTTKGLVVLPAEHQIIRRRTMPVEALLKRAHAACMQCRYCTDLCPRYLLGHRLEPHKIMRGVKHIRGQAALLKMALACSECGVCEHYACSLGLSPRVINAALKQALAKQGLKAETAPADQSCNRIQAYRKIPVKRLIARAGLGGYDRPAPLDSRPLAVKRVELLLKQHVGAPSQPVVESGQRVCQGDLVARIPDGALGASLHASIAGVATVAADRIVITAPEGSGGR